MLLELEQGVVQLLQSAGLKAHPWSGKPEELFERPKYVPAIRVVIEKVDFTKKAGYGFGLNAQVSVILFFRNLRDEGQGAYHLIKAMVDNLTNKAANGFLLTPKDITLLYHESGEFAYKVTFSAEGQYAVPEKPEPLVTEIRFEEVEQ